MDNNINNNGIPEVNPEVVPAGADAENNVIELPGAVIPEINTIGEINSLDEVIPGAPVVQEPAADVLPASEPAAPAYQVFDENPQAEVFPTGNIDQQTNGAQAPVTAYYAAPAPVSSSKGDKLALAAFIVGLCSLVMTWGAYVGFACLVLGIVGIVLASLARKNGAATSFQKAGMTLAILGLVFSLITGVGCTVCSQTTTEMFGDMLPQEVMEELQQGDTEAFEAYLNQFIAEYENNLN